MFLVFYLYSRRQLVPSGVNGESQLIEVTLAIKRDKFCSKGRESCEYSLCKLCGQLENVRFFSMVN